MGSWSVADLSKFHRRAQAHRGLNESNEGMDLRSMQAFGAEWVNSRFSGCKMGLADMRNVRLTETVLIGCSAYASNFLGATLRSCDIAETDFEQSVFSGSVIEDVVFTQCRFSFSTFAGATLKGKVRFLGCDFRGADLDFLESENVEFDGCNMWGIRVNFGCSFWNSRFDRKTVQMFAGLLARLDDDPRLVEYAGDRLPLLKRVMDRGEK